MLYKNRNDPLLNALKAALEKLGWSDEQGHLTPGSPGQEHRDVFVWTDGVVDWVDDRMSTDPVTRSRYTITGLLRREMRPCSTARAGAGYRTVASSETLYVR
jgi:hypothetical protein